MSSADAARSVVFGTPELCDEIAFRMSLVTLVAFYRVNRAFREAARSRIDILWPKLRPLLEHPFRLRKQDILTLTNFSCCNRVYDANLAAFASACGSGGKPL